MVEQHLAPDTAYRLQFHRDFTFAEALELVDYLHKLGISHIYASPFLKARAGSSHGYDIVDHNSFNPEIGDALSFEKLVSCLRSKGMGLILDFVPNHMGVGGCDNRWWLDVLENGRASIYASYFDIDWQPAKDDLRDKVLLPVLGDHYGLVLDRGELRLHFDSGAGDFQIRYHEHCFPVDPATYSRVMRYPSAAGEGSDSDAREKSEELERIIDGFDNLPSRNVSDPEKRRDRRDSIRRLKVRLSRICRENPWIEELIAGKIAAINEGVADRERDRALHELLDAQAYRLAYWRVAADEINYRRFFNINSLAGLRVEEQDTFDDVHRLVLELIGDGKIDGLRIDHPDGLYDPLAYLEKLRERIGLGAVLSEEPNSPGANGKEFYLVVEKVLAPFENLPDSWPVAGTTGYDFLNQLNGLFVNGTAERKMTAIYSNFVGHRLWFDGLLYRAKKLIITRQLSSELMVLANLIDRISETNPKTRDFTLNGLRTALIELVACFPVYRTYISGSGVSQADKSYIEWAVSQAKKWNPEEELTIFDFLREVLLGEGTLTNSDHHGLRRGFAMKLQQYTAPVMAKSMEDTAFYRYNRLVSLNEVGGDPRNFGVPMAGFHHLNRQRRQHWPLAMLTTSTHDSKRSEDARARINVLSETAYEWSVRLKRWTHLNRKWKARVNGRFAPSRNDEYMLYQNLIGAWPLEPPEDGKFALFVERMTDYFRKAIRESKENTSWLNPNEEYEVAADRFLRKIIAPSTGRDFLVDFLPFQERIAYFGMFNGLAQVVLKLTSPGVPDIYQGNELWNFSLVDPDNRRPVDFNLRREMLGGLANDFPGEEKSPVILDRLLADPHSGRIKLYVTWQVLRFRSHNKDLFRDGTYLPLAFEGTLADHLCGFSRHLDGNMAAIVVPRFCSLIAGGEKKPPIGKVWRDTYYSPITLLQERGGTFTNVFTNEKIDLSRKLPVRDILSRFPVALLYQV